MRGAGRGASAQVLRAWGKGEGEAVAGPPRRGVGRVRVRELAGEREGEGEGPSERALSGLAYSLRAAS